MNCTSSGAMDLKGQVEKYKYELGAAGSLNVHDLQQIHILVEQAKHDLRNNKPAAALHYVKRGQKLDPNVLEMLELKCQCLVKMNKYQEAVEAADTVLFKFGDALNSKALAVKAEASYNIGNFEQALLYYYRAFRTASVREREDLEKLHDVLEKISKYFRNTICILDFEKNESTESGKYINKLLEIIMISFPPKILSFRERISDQNKGGVL